VVKPRTIEPVSTIVAPVAIGPLSTPTRPTPPPSTVVPSIEISRC
jgi:hypothetical protein